MRFNSDLSSNKMSLEDLAASLPLALDDAPELQLLHTGAPPEECGESGIRLCRRAPGRPTSAVLSHCTGTVSKNTGFRSRADHCADHRDFQ